MTNESDPTNQDEEASQRIDNIRLGGGMARPLPTADDGSLPSRVRGRWWSEIMQNYGHHTCYAILLTLPSDAEANSYLTDYSKELDVISGKPCLVLILSEDEVSSWDGHSIKKWRLVVERYSQQGYSVQVAQLFGIKYTKFPCLVVFNNIRSPEHIAIPLSGLNTKEIAMRMREVFSTIQRATEARKNPIDALKKQEGLEAFRTRSGTFLGKIRGVAGQTFETALEAAVKAILAKGLG